MTLLPGGRTYGSGSPQILSWGGGSKKKSPIWGTNHEVCALGVCIKDSHPAEIGVTDVV